MALPHDIDISATRLEKKGYPVPLLKGQEFVDSVQFDPEHIDFNADVTVRFSNKWGFSTGTKVPFAFGSHDEHDPFPKFPYYDAGMGKVTEDGQWIEIVLSRFSCPSLVLPSCGPGPEGSVPSNGMEPPGSPPPRGPSCNGSCCFGAGGGVGRSHNNRFVNHLQQLRPLAGTT